MNWRFWRRRREQDDPPGLPDGEPEPPTFSERCMSVVDMQLCGSPADQFCVRCSLQVCGRHRLHHHALYVRAGALSIFACDGRTFAAEA